MNPPKINRLTNISFLDEQPSGVTTGGNTALAARLLITALALTLCPTKALSQGSITVTSGTTAPGVEIYFDWTLTGPASANGSVAEENVEIPAQRSSHINRIKNIQLFDSQISQS